MQLSPLVGSLSIPGDKSISHRSAMFSVLAEGKSEIKNVSDGGDVASTISVLRQLGAHIEYKNAVLTVKGLGLRSLKGKDLILDCGNSGTSLRLFCGLLSGQDVHNVSLVGDESLSKRPQDRVVEPLSKLGVDIKSTDSKTPVVLNSSRPKGGEVKSSVASAQVKSAILLAGLYADAPVTEIEEVFTRDHTENMLRAMGVDVKNFQENGEFKATINPPKTSLNPLTGFVPGDPSSACFFGVAACLIPGSFLVLENILGNPTRIGWVKVLQRMGAEIDIVEKAEVFGEKVIDIHVKYSELSATNISREEIPTLVDELPILALAMSMAKGKSVVSDAEELRVKESDRISLVVSHLSKMGVDIVERNDGYEINGSGNDLKSCEINPEHDHRIAMTFIIANYLSTGVLKHEFKDIISTSFPSFFDLFEQAFS